MTTEYYRAFAADLSSPIQGGDPVWDGTLPYRLPVVEVDTGPDVCAPGWHACSAPETALRISGWWRDGGLTRLFRVNKPDALIERGDKLRASSWTIVEELSVWDGHSSPVLQAWAEIGRSLHSGRSGGRVLANLRGADLRGANLYGANLYGANLYGANLRGADLRWADLEGANLRGADLRWANLYGADLRGADLRWADLEGALACGVIGVKP